MSSLRMVTIRYVLLSLSVQVVDNDQKVGVTLLAPGKWSKQIDTEFFPRCLDGGGLHQSCWLLIVCLISLVDAADFHVVPHILSN